MLIFIFVQIITQMYHTMEHNVRPNIDKIRFQFEIEKRRGHFALNYLPYVSVGSLSHLDIHHSKFSLPKISNSNLNLEVNNFEHSNPHLNPFSRHNKLPIHPESNRKGRVKQISYSGGFSNILMELKTGEERLKLARIGKPYQEILLEENQFEKILAIPNSISFQNIHNYLKKNSSVVPENSSPKERNSQINRKLVISDRFRPMLFLCRILASMKGNSTVPTGCQEKCITKIYTIYLLLNGIYNTKARDLKSKVPLSKQKLKEIFRDLDIEHHRHYSHHNIHSSYNHYHHHYTTKVNSQPKPMISPLILEQAEQLSSHNLGRRRAFSIYPSNTLASQEIEELAIGVPLWQKIMNHPHIERQDHSRKKSLWDLDEVCNIKQNWAEKLDHINYLNAKDVQVDLAEWRKEMKDRIGYKLEFLDSNKTFLKSIFQMRDDTVYALEDDSLKKGKGYPVWVQSLEKEAKESSVSNKTHVILSKMKAIYGAEDVKSVPHAKEKLCLIFFSMASTDVTLSPVMEAFKFVLKSILQDNPDCFPHWMQHREIPLPTETK